MVIVSFDGRNAVACIDGIELKVISAVLEQIGDQQVKNALGQFAFDKMEVSAKQVESYCTAASHIMRSISDNIHNRSTEPMDAEPEPEPKLLVN